MTGINMGPGGVRAVAQGVGFTLPPVGAAGISSAGSPCSHPVGHKRPQDQPPGDMSADPIPRQLLPGGQAVMEGGARVAGERQRQGPWESWLEKRGIGMLDSCPVIRKMGLKVHPGGRSFALLTEKGDGRTSSGPPPGTSVPGPGSGAGCTRPPRRPLNHVYRLWDRKELVPQL